MRQSVIKQFLIGYFTFIFIFKTNSMIITLLFLATLILVVVILIFTELHTHLYSLGRKLSSNWLRHKNGKYNWLVIIAFFLLP